MNLLLIRNLILAQLLRNHRFRSGKPVPGTYLGVGPLWRNSELLQLSYLLDHRLIGVGELLLGILVSRGSLVKIVPYLDIGIQPALELGHEFLCGLIYIGDVLLLFMLLPGHLDHVQHYYQGHLADDEYIIVLCNLPEPRGFLKHEPERSFHRNEHYIVVDLAAALRYV